MNNWADAGARVDIVQTPVTVRVAGLEWLLRTSPDVCPMLFDAACARFIVPPTRPPALELWAEVGALPDAPGTLLFDSGSVWRWERAANGDHLISMRAPQLGARPFRLARWRADLTSIQVITRDDVAAAWRAEGRLTDNVQPDPLEFPLFELLALPLLARRSTVLLHACGVLDGEAALVFAGNSTHGKSTMAALWLGDPAATLLCDDRVALQRVTPGSWLAHGTPWHGDVRLVRPHCGPLRAVFILAHGREHAIERLEPRAAALALLQRVIAPWWNPPVAATVADLCTQLAAELPVYRLRFARRPDVRAFVREAVTMRS